MKTLRFRKISILVSLILCLFLVSMNQAFAAESEYGLELHVTHGSKAISGAEFEIYRVGEVYGSGLFTLSGAFAKYPVKVNVSTTQEMQNAADTLYAYAKVDKLKPNTSASVDESGVLVISDLNKGLYLVAGKTLTIDKKTYHFQPMLISLPHDGKNHVVMNVKYSVVENGTEPTSLKVLKSWKDSGYSGKRPRSISVYLLKNGNIHDVVELNKENNWRYEWTALDSSAQWSVSEEVLSKYTTVIRKEGEKTFLIVNTYIKPDDDDDDDYDPPTKETSPPHKDPYIVPNESQPPKSDVPFSPDDDPDVQVKGEFQIIPQTGMNWWPAGICAAIGVSLIVFGILVRRRERDE